MSQRDYFVGVTDTNFSAGAGGGTVPSGFSQPSSTASSSGQPAPASPAGPPGLVEWLNSAESRPYEGQWVLLSDDLDVLDSGASPSEILERHPQIASPLIVLVEPRGARLAV